MEEEFFVVNIDRKEQIKCLRKINKKIVRSIYVYELAMENPTKYNYKDYVKNILIFVQTSDIFFDGELLEIKIGLSSILDNDFDKRQYKTIVFECKNYIDYMLEKIESGEEI